jgi:Winged helix DNA-binding domain
MTAGAGAGGAAGRADGWPGPDVLAGRFAAQLLTGEPGRSAVDVTRRLLAVQGQDPRGARLAIRVRSAGLGGADIDRALTAERSLLITWLNRGTLHLVSSEDYWWLHPLTTPPLFTASARRLAQEGVPPGDADRAVAVIEASLAADGPLTRAQLAERITAAGVRTEGQALVHILLLASLRGHVVRGPMIGAQHAYVLVRDWLGAPPAVFDRDIALAELARRYLAGHGPADDRDLAKWAGLPLRDARRGLHAIAGELSQRDDGLADLAKRGAAGRTRVAGKQAGPAAAASASPGSAAPVTAGAQPAPRLLGPFDPLLLGWASRAPVLGGHQGVVTVNGLFRAFALVGGRAAATWSLSVGQLTLTPFAPLAAADEAALMADADDVLRFLGLPPRPAPAARGRLAGLSRASDRRHR